MATTVVSFLKHMIVLGGLALLLIILGIHFYYQKMSGRAAEKEKIFVVAKILDSETLQLENGEKVRLIGLKYPHAGNRKPAGIQSGGYWKDAMFLAKNLSAAKSFLMDRTKGKIVQLQYDPAHAATNYRDRKGRLLAYVWLKELELSIEQDWLVADIDRHPYGFPVLLNACLVRGGYAYADESAPLELSREFKLLQEESAEERRGIWAEP